MSGENNESVVTDDTTKGVESTQTDATATGEPSTSEQGDTPDGEAKAEKPRLSKRIDELTRKQRTAERERDYWRDVALQNQQGKQEPAKTKESETQSALKPEDFDSYEAYLEAKAEAKAAETFERKQSEHKQREQERIAQEEAARVQESLSQKLESARERYDDFDEVVTDPSVPISNDMALAIAECDHAGEVAYFLGKNPNEAARIAALNPRAQVREITRLDDRLGGQKKEVKKPVPTVSPVRGQTGQFTKDPAKMTDAEWAASRRKK